MCVELNTDPLIYDFWQSSRNSQINVSKTVWPDLFVAHSADSIERRDTPAIYVHV